MVEYAINYNSVFQALADETRRDILRRVIDGEKTITQIAKRYSMSFAAIAKHLTVLEAASLIVKRKKGRSQIISANPETISQTTDYLKRYEKMWRERLNNLEKVIKEDQ